MKTLAALILWLMSGASDPSCPADGGEISNGYASVLLEAACATQSPPPPTGEETPPLTPARPVDRGDRRAREGESAKISNGY